VYLTKKRSNKRELSTEDITSIFVHAANSMSVVDFCDTLGITRDNYYNTLRFLTKDQIKRANLIKIAQIVGFSSQEIID
jgi:hypothetical protein